MFGHSAPAWTADWLSGWLAAIGVTILCDDVLLSWNSDTNPSPVFWTETDTPLAETIAAAYPAANFVGLSSARLVSRQEPSLAEYSAGAAESRLNGDWLWSSLFTDLGPNRSKKTKEKGVQVIVSERIDRSLFYPGAPGANGIVNRLTGPEKGIAKTSWGNAQHIAQSMDGSLPRSEGTGLGFDCRRLQDPTDPHPEMRIDHVVESLALFSTILFPIRGDGARTTTRGESRTKAAPYPSFRWTTWSDPLDAPGIDAVLGQMKPSTATFEIVKYKFRGKETNAGYFSRRIRG